MLSLSFAYTQTQYATTENGKKVILNSNGTWKYVNENTIRKLNFTASGSSTGSQSKLTSSNTNSKSRNYIRGPRGGCYYINGNGGKTYVDRSLCN